MVVAPCLPYCQTKSGRIRDPAELERERAERQRVERIEEHHERLYQQGLQLQERGAELLRGLPANGIRLKDAVDTIQAGLNLEAFSLMTSEDKVPLLALGEEQLKRLTDADANTLIRLLQKAVGDAPEKRYKPPKTKPYPWQYDFEKIPYMTQQEKAAHQRKVDTERRARGYGTQDISSIW